MCCMDSRRGHREKLRKLDLIVCSREMFKKYMAQFLLFKPTNEEDWIMINTKII